jgi:hypothetical protein
MRGFTFGLLALAVILAWPFPVSGVMQTTGSDQTPILGPLPEQDTPTRVADLETRVAAMVREALRAPEKDETWACLDLALSEMNAPAAEGQAWSSQAKRVADSLACPGGTAQEAASSSAFPPTPPGGPLDGSSVGEFLSGAWQRVHPTVKGLRTFLAEEPWFSSVLLLLASTTMVWLGRRSILGILGNSERSTDRAPAPRIPTSGRMDPPENPVAMALALWEGGLPSPEIARRTGLAQDAVSVVLALRTRGDPVPAAARPSASSNPYAASGMERR